MRFSSPNVLFDTSNGISS